MTYQAPITSKTVKIDCLIDTCSQSKPTPCSQGSACPFYLIPKIALSILAKGQWNNLDTYGMIKINSDLATQVFRNFNAQ